MLQLIKDAPTYAKGGPTGYNGFLSQWRIWRHFSFHVLLPPVSKNQEKLTLKEMSLGCEYLITWWLNSLLGNEAENIQKHFWSKTATQRCGKAGTIDGIFWGFRGTEVLKSKPKSMARSAAPSRCGSVFGTVLTWGPCKCSLSIAAGLSGIMIWEGKLPQLTILASFKLSEVFWHKPSYLIFF